MGGLGGEYWYRNLREPVRFDEATRAVLGAGGVGAFVEVSPHPVLTVGVQETVEAAEREAVVVGSLRRDEGGLGRFLRSVAELWVAGGVVDWGRVFAGSGGVRVGLPSYAFQRERFWLSSAGGVGDVAAIGQASAGHPLLGAVVGLAGGGCVFTGRLSLESHPWLADHVMLGTVLLPGTALLELASYAGRELGCPVVRELVLEAPLVLGEDTGVQVQVCVGESGEHGARTVEVYSRAERASGAEDASEGAADEGDWTRHASGVLACDEDPVVDARAVELGGTWPPPGAVAVDIDDAYERLIDAGLEYGPAFQGLRGVWRRGEEFFAEVALGDEQAGEARSYGVHPALLDSALQALALASLGESGPEGAGDGRARVAFAWSGVQLGVGGSSRLRVNLTAIDGGGAPSESALSLVAVNSDGELVLSVGSLAAREVSPNQLRGVGEQRDSLFVVDWVPVEVDGGIPVATGEFFDVRSLDAALTAGGELPSTVVLDVAGGHELALQESPPVLARGVLGGVLGVLQRWLASERPVGARLVVLTRGALEPRDGADGLAGAGVWGLVRAAQSELPGRVWLVDVDGEETSGGALGAALACEGEPQLAIREGEVLAPRLTRAPVEEAQSAEGGAEVFDPGRSVVVTGGTGMVGGLVARHLVVEHGVRSLVLASRRGLSAPGAVELQEELEGLGARVAVVECDVRDREQVVKLLAEVPQALPLGMVVHAAAVLDDGAIGSLSPARLEGVLGPKTDAAWHLHELTADMELGAFVLCSSAAGLLGLPGQGGGAAANAFLDALAVHRRARGLAGTSIAWGPWQPESEPTAGQDEAGRARMRRSGLLTLSSAEGLALLDRACARGEAQLVGMRLDTATARRQARAGLSSTLLRGLVRTPARRLGSGLLARRLAGVSEPERARVVLELVRAEAAVVLGHTSGRSIEPERAFKDLGVESLTAVELRNRLNAATGLQLPATLVFDHPTPAAVADLLLSEVAGARRELVAVAPAGRPVDEPIAIVGMSCRYPGGARSPQELWELVARGGDAIGEFPADRGWDLERCTTPIPTAPAPATPAKAGSCTTRPSSTPGSSGSARARRWRWIPSSGCCWKGAWEALEDAGIDPLALRGSQTGVFAGVMPQRLRDCCPVGARETRGVLAGRVRRQRRVGPRGVRAGSGGSGGVGGHGVLVLAGGDAPGVPGAARGRVLAGAGGRRDGAGDARTVRGVLAPARACARTGGASRSRTAADGGGWAEGVGVVVLERLSDAQRNGHRVLAVVRGSAVNQDGASNGLTAPNGPSQQRVIRQALANAGLSAGRGGCGGGARHGHDAGRSDRGAGAARDLRPGAPGGPAAVAGVDQVEHRPHPGRGRGGRGDQDGAGDAARRAAADAARGRAFQQGGLGERPGVAAAGGAAVGARRAPASCRGLRRSG